MADKEENKKEEVKKEETVNNKVEEKETKKEESKKAETKKEDKKKEETKKEESKKSETKQDSKATIDIDTDKIKKESKATFDEVKDSMKKVDLKNDTEETKNLVINLFKNPIKTIKGVAKKGESNFKIALLLLIVWAIVCLVLAASSRIGLFGFAAFGRSVLEILKAVISPILSVLVLSGTILIMNKSNKKSLTAIISTVIFAQIPVIVATVLKLLTIISSRVSMITTPIAGFANMISVVLLYFGMKEIFEEKEDNTFIKKFAIVIGIYYIVAFVLSFLGISI